VSETGLAKIDRAQDRPFTEIEHSIHKCPVCDLIVWSDVEPVALNDCVP
jgi:hypothetical protein